MSILVEFEYSEVEGWRPHRIREVDRYFLIGEYDGKSYLLDSSGEKIEELPIDNCRIYGEVR